MRSVVLGALALFAILMPAGAMAQGKVTSMLPAEPVLLHTVDDLGGCTDEQRYFMGVVFQVWSGDAKMIRLAEQAATAYASKENMVVYKDSGHRFIRALEVRDFPGLARFLKSIKGDESVNMDVMVVAIPTDKRFASVDEQIDAWEEIYIQDVVELGAQPCSARGK